MEILTHVYETNGALGIQEQRRGVGHPLLDRLGLLLQDPECADQLTPRVGQEEDPARQAELVDEHPAAFVDLGLRHHPHDPQVRRLLECLPQLDEPRLREGSPIDAAFEGDQDPMAEQVFAGVFATGEIDLVIGTHALLTAARETGLPTMVAGNSLGGLAALLAATAFDLAGLIVRNPPALRAVIRSRRAWWNGWLGAYLIAAMVPRQVEPHGALAEAKTPAIFIRSLDDRVVPAHLQQQLIDRYAAPKQQIDLPGADHDAPLEADQQAVFRTQLDWLRARFTR